MNRRVLIGNGFDLAHGMKTKYSDFILWYFNNAIIILNNEIEYKDRLLVLKFKDSRIANFKGNFTSMEQFKNKLKYYQSDIFLNIKSPFFKILYEKFNDLDWINIEAEYYSFLKGLFTGFVENVTTHSTRGEKK